MVKAVKAASLKHPVVRRRILWFSQGSGLPLLYAVRASLKVVDSRQISPWLNLFPSIDLRVGTMNGKLPSLETDHRTP